VSRLLDSRVRGNDAYGFVFVNLSALAALVGSVETFAVDAAPDRGAVAREESEVR